MVTLLWLRVSCVTSDPSNGQGLEAEDWTALQVVEHFPSSDLPWQPCGDSGGQPLRLHYITLRTTCYVVVSQCWVVCFQKLIAFC